MGQELGLKTVKNSLWNILGYAVSFILGFIVTPLVILKLGVEDYGYYALMTAMIAPLGLTDMGFRRATIKYMAQYIHQGNYKEAGKYLQTTFLLNIFVGLFGMTLIIWLGPYFFEWFFNISEGKEELIQRCLYFIASLWFFNITGSVFSSIPIASQKFKYVAIGELVNITLNYSLVIGFVLMNTGLLGYTIANALGVFVSFFFWMILGRRLLPGISFLPSFHKVAWRNSFNFGIWETISYVGGITSQQAEKYLIGAYLSISAVGIYNIALSLEQKAYVALYKLSEVLFPTFSSMTEESKSRKADLIIRSTWIMSLLGTSVLIALIPLSRDMLTLWISEEVASEGGYVLQSLLLAGAISLATMTGMMHLLGEGKTKLLAMIALLDGTITVILSAILLQRIGLKAAGLAILIAMVTRIVIISFILLRIYRDQMKSIQIFASMFFPLMIGTFMVGIVIYTDVINVNSWFDLIAEYLVLIIAIGFGTYFSGKIFPGNSVHEKDIKNLYNKLRMLLTK